MRENAIAPARITGRCEWRITREREERHLKMLNKHEGAEEFFATDTV